MTALENVAKQTVDQNNVVPGQVAKSNWNQIRRESQSSQFQNGIL